MPLQFYQFHNLATLPNQYAQNSVIIFPLSQIYPTDLVGYI
jgi:hypothetical protein